MDSRYSRQEIYPPIGKAGQQKIGKAHIAIVGCGALGSLQAEVLTRAGIGFLTIIDRDFVEPVNLQRQSLFTEENARQSIPKAIAAAERLKEINSNVEVKPFVSDLNSDNVRLLSGVDLIVDGTDNFQTRYLLNDFAWKQRIPWIYGACVGSSAVACAFVPPDFPCLRCLFEAEPAAGSAPTCDTAGIIWPAVGTVVAYQVATAFQILVGHDLSAQLLQADLWQGYYHTVSLKNAKRPDCTTCALHLYPSLERATGFEIAMCGRDAVQIKPQSKGAIALDEVEERWKNIGVAYRNPFLAKLIIGENEIVLFSDGRAIIKGTQDPVRARDLYSKYVGS